MKSLMRGNSEWAMTNQFFKATKEKKKKEKRLEQNNGSIDWSSIHFKTATESTKIIISLFVLLMDLKRDMLLYWSGINKRTKINFIEWWWNLQECRLDTYMNIHFKAFALGYWSGDTNRGNTKVDLTVINRHLKITKIRFTIEAFLRCFLHKYSRDIFW